ncbi:YlxR family protein [Allonocardiopsis opalescens]|uniref:YlxR family protein n=1 Tax=Allonocardiopsis opalescens TaxID=1144618 RepID=UPI000D06DFD9|nr:YlxR family protein [Allonocardiopsis opalescens]
MPRRARLDSGDRKTPVRTCVGCRSRAAKSDLLRLVVVEDVIVPDPNGRLPGRGASIHPSSRCLELAERRRAFTRAFRLARPPDTTRLRTRITASEDGPATGMSR